jgi:alpha-acetolactate decarboxylase
MTLLLKGPRVGHSPRVVPAVQSVRPQPTAAQILRHGDHGLGVLEGYGSFVIVRGRCYTLLPDFSVEETVRRTRARSAAVTRFRPEQLLAFRRPQTMSQLIPQLEFGADRHALGAFRIDAWFSFVRLQGSDGGSGTARKPVDSDPQVREFSDVMGTIVGFRNVDADGDGPNAARLNFVDKRRQFGGRVVDFEVLQARAELAPLTLAQPRD